jgi:nitroreductase/NAD-dependent dihydropyrimidine dehydrogenase PreA subunit
MMRKFLDEYMAHQSCYFKYSTILKYVVIKKSSLLKKNIKIFKNYINVTIYQDQGEKYSMSMFIIDEKKCRKDGICVQACPMGILVQKDKTALPVPVKIAEELCIQCGHCVAVCPHGAFSLKNMPSEECPPVREEWLLNAEQAEHFLRSRRSIRVYKNKPVDKELITRLIETARYAPSGHNSQPVEWLVVYESQDVQRLAAHVIDWMQSVQKENPELAAALSLDLVIKRWQKGKDVICRNAPHLIVAHAPRENPTASTAAAIALSYLELAAPSLGLGTCWAGYLYGAALSWPPIQEFLSLPEGHITYGIMMAGYPEYKYHRLPLRRKPEISWR